MSTIKIFFHLVGRDESEISDGSELEFLVSITKTWSGYLKVQFRFQTLFHFHRDQIHEDQVVIP